MKTTKSHPLTILMLLVLLVAIPKVTFAQGRSVQYEGPTVFVQQLETEKCATASERQLDVPLHGNFTYCLMIFDDKNGAEYELSASIRINDAIVSLKRISVESASTKGPHGGPRTISRYRSANKAILVVLDVETVNDNCGGDEDKCCGAYFEGTLTVTSKRQKTSYPVYFYRGG